MKVKDLIVLLQAYEAQNPDTPVYLLNDERGLLYDVTIVQTQHAWRTSPAYPGASYDELEDSINCRSQAYKDAAVEEKGLLLQ